LTAVGADNGAPWLAWTVFAAGGAVLLTVDATTHLLPARFLYPLAGIICAILILAAEVTQSTPALLRSACAGLIVGALWLLLALSAPAALGLGDIRLFSLSATLLGWLGWPAVAAGQLLTFLLAPVAAAVIRITVRPPMRTTANIPMGPPAVVATIVVSWVMHT
jgi:leader peptidase (prepilin peptidase)/N-methyltransferase